MNFVPRYLNLLKPMQYILAESDEKRENLEAVFAAALECAEDNGFSVNSSDRLQITRDNKVLFGPSVNQHDIPLAEIAESAELQPPFQQFTLAAGRYGFVQYTGDDSENYSAALKILKEFLEEKGEPMTGGKKPYIRKIFEDGRWAVQLITRLL